MSFGSRWRTSRPTTRRAATGPDHSHTSDPGTGTNPLPIYLAYLNGLRGVACRRSDCLHGRQPDVDQHSARPSGWSRPTRYRRRRRRTSIDDLGRRTNALRAGLPANFFIVNPDIDDLSVTDSGAYSDYHALQLELKRRLSRGLQANVSYQYAVEGGSSFLGLPLRSRDDPGGERAARDQDTVGLGDPGRPRTAFRLEHEPDPERHPRRMAVQRRRSHSGADDQFRQRPARRDDARRAHERLQA